MFLCSRYRRKGSSSLGLDPRFQGITWEESEQSAKKKKKADVKRRKADRYFSKDSQQLLRSEPALPSLPRIGAGNDAPRIIDFITLAGEEGMSRGETGRIHFILAVWSVVNDYVQNRPTAYGSIQFSLIVPDITYMKST